MKTYIMKNKFIWGIILSFLLFSGLTYAEEEVRIKDNEDKWTKFEYYNKYNIKLYYVTATYNEAGQLIKGTEHLLGGKVVRYVIYDYDSNGKLKTITSFKPNKKKKNYIQYTYDKSGKSIKGEFFNAKGKLKDYSEFNYNDMGLLIKENLYDRKGKSRGHVLSEYDAQGKLVNDVIYGKKGKLKKVTVEYAYNKDGTLASTKYFPHGFIKSPTSFHTYKYTYE